MSIEKDFDKLTKKKKEKKKDEDIHPFNRKIMNPIKTSDIKNTDLLEGEIVYDASNVLLNDAKNEIEYGSVDEVESIMFTMTKKWLIVILIITFLLGFSLGIISSKINNMNNLLDQYQINADNNKAMIDTNKKLSNELSLKENYINELNSSISKYDYENKSLETELEKRDVIISLFSQREELHDKYNYAIITNERTDLTYGQIAFAEQEMISRNMDPNLILELFKLESNFDETATSNFSTARGYGQFLGSTAKWIWEECLENGPYNHNMAFDGYVNIEMTAEYLGLNLQTYNGDIRKTLVAYNGNEIGNRYYEIIDKNMMQDVGYGLDTVEVAYNN